MADKIKFSSELKGKIKYNTKINRKYFKIKRLQQWGAKKNGNPILIDDLDIMERIDIFDMID